MPNLWKNLILQQTDTAAGYTQIRMYTCSTIAAAAVYGAKAASEGGTPGVVTITNIGPLVNPTGTFAVLYIDCTIPAIYTKWPAGDWTVYVNLPGVIGSVVWDRCYICRHLPGIGLLGTFMGVSYPNVNVSAGGIFSTVVSCVGVTAPIAGSRVVITLTMSGNSVKDSYVDILPDQTIITPFINDRADPMDYEVRPARNKRVFIGV